MRGCLFWLAVVFGVGAIALWGPWGANVPLPGRCTLGVVGTAAKMTVSGWGAEQVCQRVAATTTGPWYRSSSGLTSTETVRCQRVFRPGLMGLEVTVTDTGMGIVAAAMCTSLKNAKEGP
jgi:hypothetical protein